MSENVKLVLTLIIGYLLGSISTGVIVSRVFGHKDIRSEGSGNSDVRAQGHPKRGQRQFGHDKHAARDG